MKNTNGSTNGSNNGSTNIKELQKRINELKESFRDVGNAYKAWQQAVETQDIRRNSLNNTYRNMAINACTSAYELMEVLDLVDAELMKIRLKEAEVKPTDEAELSIRGRKILATPAPMDGYMTGFKVTTTDTKEEEKEGKTEE